MSTVILKWNPGFSSYTMIRFLGDLEKCALANKDVAEMNWSIWDYDQVHEGDTFYMLKVGYGQTGIVARGKISSESYSGEDWSWQNRPTRYCDLQFEVMINPDAFPLLDSKMLSQAVPGFDWYGGHSGVVLAPEQAAALEEQWGEYVKRQAEYFGKASDQNLFMLCEEVQTGNAPYSMQLHEKYDGNYVVITYKEGDIVTKITVYNYHRILGKLGVRSWRALQQLLLSRYPTRANLPALCADLFNAQVEYRADFYRNDDDDDDE